jgi:hypothetical protein
MMSATVVATSDGEYEIGMVVACSYCSWAGASEPLTLKLVDGGHFFLHILVTGFFQE